MASNESAGMFEQKSGKGFVNGLGWVTIGQLKKVDFTDAEIEYATGRLKEGSGFEHPEISKDEVSFDKEAFQMSSPADMKPEPEEGIVLETAEDGSYIEHIMHRITLTAEEKDGEVRLFHLRIDSHMETNRYIDAYYAGMTLEHIIEMIERMLYSDNGTDGMWIPPAGNPRG